MYKYTGGATQGSVVWSGLGELASFRRRRRLTLARVSKPTQWTGTENIPFVLRTKQRRNNQAGISNTPALVIESVCWRKYTGYSSSGGILTYTSETRSRCRYTPRFFPPMTIPGGLSESRSDGLEHRSVSEVSRQDWICRS